MAADDIKSSIKEINTKQDQQSEKLISISENVAKHSISLDYYKENIIDINSSLKDINTTLVKQEANLAEHMRRSLANEKAVAILESKLDPIDKHVHTVGVFFKAVGYLAATAAAILGIMKYLGAL